MVSTLRRSRRPSSSARASGAPAIFTASSRRIVVCAPRPPDVGLVGLCGPTARRGSMLQPRGPLSAYSTAAVAGAVMTAKWTASLREGVSQGAVTTLTGNRVEQITLLTNGSLTHRSTGRNATWSGMPAVGCRANVPDSPKSCPLRTLAPTSSSCQTAAGSAPSFVPATSEERERGLLALRQAKSYDRRRLALRLRRRRDACRIRRRDRAKMRQPCSLTARCSPCFGPTAATASRARAHCRVQAAAARMAPYAAASPTTAARAGFSPR